MIEIQSQTEDFMAAHNFMSYRIRTDNFAEPNFNFVIDVRKRGDGDPILARLIYPVQPSSDSLTLDIGCVLKNYVSYDFTNVTSALIAANTNSRLNYFCDFRELYDVAGVPTLSEILISNPSDASGFKVASNAIFDFEDYTPSAYEACDVSGFGFLNQTLTDNEHISLSQHRILSFFDPNRVVTAVKITANGIGPVTIPVTETAAENIFNINAGKYLFDTAGSITEPTTIIVQVLAGSTVLGTKTYTAPPDCSIYENIRLHWLNKLGGFEAYNFNKVSKDNEDISRKQFKTPLQIGYAQSDRLKSNYNTTIVDKITVNSDWITDELAVYFEQLMTSPVIYLERSATDFIAVNITNIQYEQKKYVNERKLFNITFDIEYSYNRYRQTI